ncbi:alpha/beta hydrolase [Georgenia muralis]
MPMTEGGRAAGTLAPGTSGARQRWRRPRSWRRRRWQAALGVLAVVLGTVLAAVGLGIGLPRLGVGIVGAVLALSVAVVGVVLVVAGTLALVRVSRGWLRVPVALVAAAASLLGVYLLTTPVIASVPPRSAAETAAPPAGAEEVFFRTADGVRLAAWYVPSGTGAAVVLMHGSGSSRAAVVDHAEVLAGAGYGVLAVDARGHGESSGRGMRWGWFGDADVGAAVTYLTGRDDVDPARIAAVGLSMGGEEVIGAAAGDERIRAVVAEGVTGRSAADLGWLSEGYGWRGSLQEALEVVRTAAADLLSPADPPPPLRDAVAETAPRPVLLVVAGTVEEEALAAADLADHGVVTVWTVDGADHMGGLGADPDGWTTTVVGFLDANTR